MTARRACTAFAAALFLFATNVQALPSIQAPTQQAREKAPEPVTGELVSIDTDSKAVVVRTAENTETKFSFSEDTEIVGAGQGASGLATVSGATVTVTYQIHGTANVASKIEVIKKK